MNLKQIKANIESVESIKLITQALGDIATTEIKANRKAIEHNIKFFQAIDEVYQMVKRMALNNPEYLKTERKKNGKTIAVLLTSNYHFNGTLDGDLTKLYLSQTANLICDRMVIGKSGIQLLEPLNSTQHYEKVLLQKDIPSYEELKDLAQKVFAYSKIYVFHIKFMTLLNQIPTVSDISATDVSRKPKEGVKYYLVEPEIGKMVTFFDSQILVLLFQAIFLETNIARTAARMISMNQAEENAQKVLNNEKKAALRAKKHITNIRILETFAGLKGRV